MRRFKTIASAIVVALVVITCVDYVASAATGGKFILGQLNKANKQTTLKRTTGGSPLGLTTKSSSNAPLATNGRGRVANLNADLVDGLDSSALRTSSYSWTKSVAAPVANVTVDIPLGPGTYVIGYDAYMVNGGLDGSVAGCYVWRQRGTDYVYYAETRYASLTGNSVGASASSIVSIASGDDLRLYCYAPTNWDTDPAQPIHIYAIRTTVAGGGALRIAPDGARRAH